MKLLLRLSALCFVLVLFQSRAHAQGMSVTNVSFKMVDSTVVIRYDLNADTSKVYKVSVALRREGLSSFRLIPIDVKGDIGTGHFAGKDREIVWYLYHDAPYGLDGDDFYFEVTVNEIGQKGGGIAWYYYVGTAIVGGVAAVLVHELAGKSGASSLPMPPARP